MPKVNGPGHFSQGHAKADTVNLLAGGIGGFHADGSDLVGKGSGGILLRDESVGCFNIKPDEGLALLLTDCPKIAADFP